MIEGTNKRRMRRKKRRRREEEEEDVKDEKTILGPSQCHKIGIRGLFGLK